MADDEKTPGGWEPPAGATPPGEPSTPPYAGDPLRPGDPLTPPPQEHQPPPPAWPPPAGGYGSPMPPPAAGYGQPSGTNGKATAALVLGICGLVVCPLICAILALVFGYQARGEIDRSNGAQDGRGSATAGIVLGWIGLVLGLIGLVLVLGAMATVDSVDDPTFDLDQDFNFDTIVRVAGAALRLAL